MTIYEVTTQLHRLSVGGYFNGKKFTVKELRTYILSMFRAGGNSLIMTIALPDGWWYFEILQNDKYGYDYVIPDTREQENHIKNKLVIN